MLHQNKLTSNKQYICRLYLSVNQIWIIYYSFKTLKEKNLLRCEFCDRIILTFSVSFSSFVVLFLHINQSTHTMSENSKKRWCACPWNKYWQIHNFINEKFFKLYFVFLLIQVDVMCQYWKAILCTTVSFLGGGGSPVTQTQHYNTDTSALVPRGHGSIGSKVWWWWLCVMWQ